MKDAAFPCLQWSVAWVLSLYVSGLTAQELPPPPRPATDSVEVDAPAVRAESGDAAVAPPAGVMPPPKHRDPFWPVGYVPRKATPAHVATPAAAPVLTQDWEEARKKLDISGISRSGEARAGSGEKYLAIVNGKLVEEGDMVAVVLDGQQYRWKIRAIGPRGVTLTKLDTRVP